jgi:hypothetical protein
MATEKFGLLCYATSSHANEYEPSGYEQPEIHLNIWEQEKSSKQAEEAFLDIGLMLDINYPANTIELIFPWEVLVKDLIDLSSAIATSEAIPAIFNESWAVSSVANGYVVYASPPKQSAAASKSNQDRISFSIVNIHGSLTASSHDARWGTIKTKVHSISVDINKLKVAAEKASKNTGIETAKFYIRFRVPNIKKDFYCADTNAIKEDFSAILQQRTEDIDFRLNVRRGAPPNLVEDLGKFVEFSKVHLFLMRSRDKDIVFQDKLFNASRSLEDEDFWARYSLKKTTGTPEEIETNLRRVKNSLGYHWKSISSGSSVKEFGTLARFRIVRVAMGKFVIFALILGVIGNLIPEGLKWLLAKAYPESPIEAVCVKAGENFKLPKQSCGSGTAIAPSGARADVQAQLKKE